MASSIIASDNIGGTLYEYRIAKVPRDGPEFQIQTRWERTTGNYAPWEGAAMGYYHTEKEALNSFLPRYRYGTDTNLEPLHPTIKAMADKRTREARIIAEGRKVADAKAIEDRRVDFERVSSLKTEFALATFKSNTVEIKGEKGIVLDTQKGPSIGGLTITKVGHVRGGPGYVLTHNKTGHAASPEYPTLRHAKVAAFRLTQVADFNQNLAELQATKIPFGVIANSLKVNEFIDFSDKLPPPAVLPARTLDTTPPKLITEKTKLDAKKVADRLYSAAAARGFTEGLRERPRVTDADIKKALPIMEAELQSRETPKQAFVEDIGGRVGDDRFRVQPNNEPNIKVRYFNSQERAERDLHFQRNGGSTVAPNVKLEDIPTQVAVRAYIGTSHSPESRAVHEQKDYVELMERVFEQMNTRAKTPEERALVSAEFETFRAKWVSGQLSLLGRHSGIVSSFIAGPSKFPVAQMNKRSDAYEKARSEFNDSTNKALKRALENISPSASKIISSDSPTAVTDLQRKIDKAKKDQEFMVAVNKVVKRKGSDEDKITALKADFDIDAGVAKKLLEGDFAGRKGFPDWQTSNNRANIKRMEARIAGIQQEQDRPAAPEGGSSFDGGTIVENQDINRLQLIFDDKPDADTRNKLKRAGFHWSPREGAWQRQLNENARHAARQIVGEDEILAERAEPTMEERKVTAPTTRVKDVPSLSFRAAESRFNTKTAGTGRSKRRNPVADAKRQAKVIAPAVPETAEDLALQKKWFANPNQLDFEGIDHPNPRPRSQSGANIRSRRMFRSRRM